MGRPCFMVGGVVSNFTQPLHSRDHGRHERYGSRHMKTASFDGNSEAREALTLSVAGVLVVMLVWNLMMLLFVY